MSDRSPVLDLPYLLPSQAQKHVTHNTALERLDLVTQLRLTSVESDTPPSDPNAGEVHALGSMPTGLWAGHANRLAAWTSDTWQFLDPGLGWRAWDVAEDRLVIWNGDRWQELTTRTQNLEGLGIGTNSDAANPLAVAGDSTLLSHVGGGHQLKINKASAQETASLLFQSNWTGHAEIGLAGDTGLSFKTSPDGQTWSDVLRFDPASGAVSGAAVQNAPDDVTAGRLMRADYGYSPGNLLGAVTQAGGLPTGAVIEQGQAAGGTFIRWADGTQICWGRVSLGSGLAEGAGTFADPYRTAATTLIFPMVFAAAPVGHVSCRPESSGPLGAAILSASFEISDTGLTNLRAHRMSGTNAAIDIQADYIAIGRWF